MGRQPASLAPSCVLWQLPSDLPVEPLSLPYAVSGLLAGLVAEVADSYTYFRQLSALRLSSLSALGWNLTQPSEGFLFHVEVTMKPRTIFFIARVVRKAIILAGVYLTVQLWMMM